MAGQASLESKKEAIFLARFAKKSPRVKECSFLTQITYADFEKVEMRVGKILEVENFPQARKPAYRLKIDFGPEMGVKKSSAQLTARYRREDLVDRKVIAVVNFAPKQVANFVSEVLILGVTDANGDIVLLSVENTADAVLGSRVH